MGSADISNFRKCFQLVRVEVQDGSCTHIEEHQEHSRALPRWSPTRLWAGQLWLSNECLLEQGLSNSPFLFYFFHVSKIPYMVKLHKHIFCSKRANKRSGSKDDVSCPWLLNGTAVQADFHRGFCSLSHSPQLKPHYTRT